MRTRRSIPGCQILLLSESEGARVFRRSLSGSVMALVVLLLPLFADCFTKEEEPRASDLRFAPARPLTGDKIKLYITLKNAVRAELKWKVDDGDEQIADYDGVSGYVEFDKTFKAGETLKVSLTPFTGTGESGKTVTKSVTIHNAPPILKLASQDLKGQTYEAKIEVTDPEKGKVTLKVDGPEGMTIDENGNITWRIKRGVEGNFPVKVTAKDEQGAEAVLAYAVRIRQSRGK